LIFSDVVPARVPMASRKWEEAVAVLKILLPAEAVCFRKVLAAGA